jgi:hypothetical protein
VTLVTHSTTYVRVCVVSEVTVGGLERTSHVTCPLRRAIVSPSACVCCRAVRTLPTPTLVTRRLRNLAKCQLDCLDGDAFHFLGASNVTDLDVQENNFKALPEELLWKLTSLEVFHASLTLSRAID